jgi:hypothetical protein
MKTFFIAFGISTQLLFGSVKDYHSQEELAGVKVTSSIDTTYTDFDGLFSLEVRDSNDTVRVNSISYKEMIIVTDNNLLTEIK